MSKRLLGFCLGVALVLSGGAPQLRAQQCSLSVTCLVTPAGSVCANVFVDCG